MSEVKERPVWRVVGKSVRGASHIREGLPNQDAMGWRPESGAGLPLILAVSDGHGSAKSFRSHEGSKLAVSAAIGVLEGFIKGQPDLSNLSAIKHTAEERLPQEVVRRWQDAVMEHIAKSPFAPEEFDTLAKKNGGGRQSVEENPHLVYGATVVAVLVTEAFILYLQLGDGDILTVSETNEVARPMPKDARLMGNETTSLCSTDAWRDFRVVFEPLSGPPPSLIMVSTDGYINSFKEESGFLKVASDLLKIVHEEGLVRVSEKLDTWLCDASQGGSGDDITLGLVKRDEETDVDAIMRRLRTCETELHARQEAEAREDEQERKLSALEAAWYRLEERYEFARRVFIGFAIGMGVLLVLCLAILAVSIVSMGHPR